MLLDNVANYPKTDMEKRFFSAMFGEGLLGDRRRNLAHPPQGHGAGLRPAQRASRTRRRWRRLPRPSRKHWEQLGEGAEIDISEEMTALTLQIICKTMFSSDADELIDVTGSALERTQTALNFSILDVLPIIGPMRMKRKEDEIHADFSTMDAAIYRLIAQREKTIESAPKDLLTRLIAAKDPDNGAGMNATEVRDEVLTIFMAGHETTAVTMTWVWYLLSQHPQVADKLHAELDTVLGDRAADGRATCPSSSTRAW